ncbi:hypothetical protein AVEN_221186-1 [Araneus ventricosus]|uniref:HTH psq-type domain-containing protein n=1 Tax=Araneus ventricosus TaxID=182803 RepID=A0A4Y2I3F4_ARAVE|nr:hypothetical protein AVEN_221186-1 [Araneus ventricosus]
MSGMKQNVLNDKQKLQILQELHNGESASTDAEDVLNEGGTISHSAALQSVETLLACMGQIGFDYGDITAVRRGGLVVRSRPRDRRVAGSKPDSTEDRRAWGLFHAQSYVVAKRPPVGEARKLEEGAPAQVSYLIA